MSFFAREFAPLAGLGEDTDGEGDAFSFLPRHCESRECPIGSGGNKGDKLLLLFWGEERSPALSGFRGKGLVLVPFAFVAFDSREADLELVSDFLSGLPCLEGSNNPLAEVKRVSFHVLHYRQGQLQNEWL